MSKYIVDGRPLGAHYAEIETRNVGTEFEMDMELDREQALVAAGAIRVLSRGQEAEAAPKREEKTTEEKADDAPKQTSADREQPKARRST